MSDRVIECASRAGRDFSEFMKGEKGMMEALASVDEFGERQTRRLHSFGTDIIEAPLIRGFDNVNNLWKPSWHRKS